MFISDYRSRQRTDLRDNGASPYFSDANLDDFHARALAEYAKYKPRLVPYTLPFTAGQNTILLPADFLEVDQASFERALGIVGAYNAITTAYGMLYSSTEMAAASIAGIDMDFAGWPNPYDPWSQPTRGPAEYYFLTSPPRLVVRPAPTSDATYPIFYQGTYALPTDVAIGDLPDSESRLVLAYACHLGCDGMLGDPDLLEKMKVGDREINRDEWARQVERKSARKLEEFEKVLRFRPIGSMG